MIILMFQGAIIGMLCGNAFTIWLLVGTFVKPPPNGPSSALTTYADGCGQNSTLDLDVQGVVANHTQNDRRFFYIPDG